MPGELFERSLEISDEPQRNFGTGLLGEVARLIERIGLSSRPERDSRHGSAWS